MVAAVIAAASKQQRTRWILIATVALLTAWLLAPAALPIYDGIGNPDEPYRWVKPPANAKTTKAPTGAHKVLQVSGGASQAGFANTDELGPQLSLYLPQTALKAPAGASTIDITVQPLAPEPPLPTDGTIVTNVYHLTATANGQPVSVIGKGPSEPSLQMRAPTAQQPGPVFEHRTTSGWQRARTIRVGVDVYQAQAPVLGDWALVLSTSKGGGGGINWGLLGGGIALLVVAIVVIAIRLARTSPGTS